MLIKKLLKHARHLVVLLARTCRLPPPPNVSVPFAQEAHRIYGSSHGPAPMANNFWAGKKSKFEDAKISLAKTIVEIYEGTFDIQLRSDDGGAHITLYVEVEDPSENLTHEGLIKFHHETVKWEGWRFILTKCPIGYINAIIRAPKREY
jgi:hypothetical protein